MADIGVRLSQQGQDVTTAADQDLIYSSSWPLLKLDSEVTITISDGTLNQSLYTHNIGYPPVHTISYISGGQSELFGGTFYVGQLSVDSTDLWYKGSLFPVANGTVIHVKFFRYNITTSFTAPIIKTAQQTAKDITNEYTFRIAKSGKDISSTDLRDFAVHSDTRSPLIHMSVHGVPVATTDTIAGYEVKATHNLNYPPFFLCYAMMTDTAQTTANTYTWLPTGTGGANGVLVRSDFCKYFDTAPPGTYVNYASVIVLKDPFDITNTTSVTV